ncbi:hypothetical protein VTH06DRAFT_1119, partial [Thermothelomyces fergusii]
MPGLLAHDGREVDVSRVGDELRAWLEDAGAAAAGSAARHRAQERSEKTVLVLSSLSRSLAESDFYRWAPQGRHVAGWAGAISKVVQAVSATTREPRGQYFLFFDTRRAAEACAAQLDRVYDLTRAADLSHRSGAATSEPPGSNGASPSSSPPPPPPPPLELRSRPRLMPAAALLRLIALLSPPPQKQQQEQQQPKQQRHILPTPQKALIPHGLAAHLSAHLNNNNNNTSTIHVAPTTPTTSTTTTTTTAAAAAHDDGAALAGGKWSVLVRLAGSKITVEAMARAIAADGAARNLGWRLVEARPGVAGWPRPVQALRAGSGKLGFGLSWDGAGAGAGAGAGEEVPQQQQQQQQHDDDGSGGGG